MRADCYQWYTGIGRKLGDVTMPTMRTVGILILLSGLSAVLVGCVTPAGTKNVVTTTFNKSVSIDRKQSVVWADILEWIALNGFPIKNTDKDAGVITVEGSGVTSWIFWPASEKKTSLKEELVSCGEPIGNAGIFKAQFSNMQITGSIFVRERNAETKVTVNLYGSARVEVRNGYGAVVTAANARCKSKGVFEAKMFAYLESR